MTAEQIPKYCYYRPKNETHGDKFVIDRLHPALTKEWSTTTAKNKTTLEKFNALIAKNNTLSLQKN